MSRAFINEMRNLPMPASYAMFVPGDRAEWAKQTMVDHIKTAFLAGELQISGRTPVPEAAESEGLSLIHI